MTMMVMMMMVQEQLNIVAGRSRESLQKPTKTHSIPDDALAEIQRLGL